MNLKTLVVWAFCPSMLTQEIKSAVAWNLRHATLSLTQFEDQKSAVFLDLTRTIIPHQP